MTEGPSEADRSLPPRAGKLPPSAKLVAKTLAYEGELTQSQLAEETLLPGRTVRHALSQLESEDLVTSRISFIDARQRIYTLDRDSAE
jgi:DNA-binding MarR family transcriptional regulator